MEVRQEKSKILVNSTNQNAPINTMMGFKTKLKLYRALALSILLYRALSVSILLYIAFVVSILP